MSFTGSQLIYVLRLYVFYTESFNICPQLIFLLQGVPSYMSSSYMSFTRSPLIYVLQIYVFYTESPSIYVLRLYVFYMVSFNICPSIICFFSVLLYISSDYMSFRGSPFIYVCLPSIGILQGVHLYIYSNYMTFTLCQFQYPQNKCLFQCPLIYVFRLFVFYVDSFTGLFTGSPFIFVLRLYAFYRESFNTCPPIICFLQGVLLYMSSDYMSFT